MIFKRMRLEARAKELGIRFMPRHESVPRIWRATGSIRTAECPLCKLVAAAEEINRNIRQAIETVHRTYGEQK